MLSPTAVVAPLLQNRRLRDRLSPFSVLGDSSWALGTVCGDLVNRCTFPYTYISFASMALSVPYHQVSSHVDFSNLFQKLSWILLTSMSHFPPSDIDEPVPKSSFLWRWLSFCVLQAVVTSAIQWVKEQLGLCKLSGFLLLWWECCFF